jgi:hypothetical protein
MVDEGLHSYLSTRVPSVPEATIRALFAADAEDPPDLSQSQKASLVKAIGSVKILDPACGSGAFPMGALQRLVDLLQKLDPNNESWKRDRLGDAERYYELLHRDSAPRAELAEVEARIEDIRRSFDTRFHALDFARKLYLIENCIYGVDIQPIACQIAKLRFFIVLIVDQRVAPDAPNLGVRPLPNLETRIVAADSLVGVQRQGSLRSPEIEAKEAELRRVRERHFLARTPETKARYREQDATMRTEIADLLRNEGWDASTARLLASWDPYDQNQAATFFDSEWMFNLPIGKVYVDDASTTTILGRLSLINEAGGQMEMLSPGEIESGFDIVIGNPPYVRIQTLKQQDPKLVEFYKQHYKSAKKGNYDVYVVFVEAGLKFLKPDGHLAYIMPHKFFNAQYGEPLRGLLAKGRHLRHVVHFGDLQVFPGASNYVCLLFLAKAGADSCRFVRVDDLDTWLQTFQGTEGHFSAEEVTAAEWNFTVGSGARVFDHLNQVQTRLEDVTARIFQGFKTSADKVYIVEEISRATGIVRVFSPQTGQEHDLEPDLLHPLIKGGDSKAFQLTTTNRLILFPYTRAGGKATLIPSITLKRTYPHTWSYLRENQQYLEEREDGRMRGRGWYAYGRTQALDVMAHPKIFTPDFAPISAFSYDQKGDVFFTGGAVGGYGIIPQPKIRAEFLLGL